jgi:hypothetical protein
MGASDSSAVSGSPSILSRVITAFTAGFPAMAARPPIEAARGRESRCGACALDWLSAARSHIDKIEKNLSWQGFI